MTFWLGDAPLILATHSQARKMLIANAGLDFEVIPADLDERGLQEASNLTAPRDIALLLACAKARAVSAMHPGRYVVGADQTLALGSRIFSKPDGRAAAMAQLQELAGHSHELHSAVAVARDGEVIFEEATAARMTMRSLTEAQLTAYLDAVGNAITSSVGAYQLERFGIHLFDRIDGDHFTILGLPLLPLLGFLRREGLVA